jgi:hypothetical protein
MARTPQQPWSVDQARPAVAAAKQICFFRDVELLPEILDYAQRRVFIWHVASLNNLQLD